MKLKTMRYSLVIAVVLLATLVFTMVAVGASRWNPAKIPPAPPTPTSFPPPPAPTPLPRVDNPVVTTREQAIEATLSVDSRWAIREQPLTKERIAADPDMIIVEPYETQQEAFDIYAMGEIPDKGPPAWVVIIKGKVSVQFPGIAGMHGPRECDGVTYFISQVDGRLLGVSGNIAEKRGEKSP